MSKESLPQVGQTTPIQPQLRCEKPKVFYVFARVQIPSAPPSSPAGFPTISENREKNPRVRAVCDPHGLGECPRPR